MPAVVVAPCCFDKFGFHCSIYNAPRFTYPLLETVKNKI